MKWKCPKCGREFSRQSQDHYCIKPQSVDEYIAAQDETIQPKLNEIRTVLRSALPDAEERIAWSMPTYRKDHNIIHFAAQKKHIGLYPGPEAVAYFSGRLDQAGLLYSKGSIQIPYSDDLPLELIAEIADWCRSTGNHA
jgi:uncharacterized protein YdhG (YjbR/CyaY superfamily)